MTGSPPLFSLPLGNKPELLWMAEGVHGPGETKTYRFEGLWIVHLYTYTGTLSLDGQKLDIRPGCAGVMPPGATSVTHFPLRSRHLFAHFTLPGLGGSSVSIPAIQDLGGDFQLVLSEFTLAMAHFETNPLRAEIKLWETLWRLAECAAQPVQTEPRRHPAVERAVALIARRLGGHIRVSELAREVDISHNHLNRLFREATGESVAAYIRRQRVDRARHLLVHSSLPIKAVAAEVGLPDLHHFNKTIRSALGDCPRGIRCSR